MIIESIELKNFRNYKSLRLQFDSGTNIFYGDNAQGKTNILEAVYICGTTKSHKGSKDREIIKFLEEESHIKMIIRKNDITYKIDMHLKKNKTKGIAINGIPIKKASELFGIVNIVFFSPEDLNIIKNGPSERRRFVDSELCQLNKIYLYHLANYNKVLLQRNKLLKEIYFHPDYADTLDVWDEQMVKFGSYLILSREKFIAKLNIIIYQIHKNLTGNKEELYLFYEPNVKDCMGKEEAAEDGKEENKEVLFIQNQFIKELTSQRERDIKFKTSTVGPHRDDLCFRIKNIDIRKYGSQGQQRTAALSLKMAEIELVKQMIGDTPVLLLDDVLSELDSSRQNYLLNSIHDIQTLITCTGLDEFIHNRFQLNKVFQVVEGEVSIPF